MACRGQHVSFSLFYNSTKNINANPLLTLTHMHAHTHTHTHTSKYCWLQFSDGWRSNRSSLEDKISTRCRGLKGKKMKVRSIWRVRKRPTGEEAGRRTVLIRQVMRNVQDWVPLIRLFMLSHTDAFSVCFQYTPQMGSLISQTQGFMTNFLRQKDKREVITHDSFLENCLPVLQTSNYLCWMMCRSVSLKRHFLSALLNKQIKG